MSHPTADEPVLYSLRLRTNCRFEHELHGGGANWLWKVGCATTAHDRLDEPGWTKLLGRFSGYPKGEVEMTWHAKESVRWLYAATGKRSAGVDDTWTPPSPALALLGLINSVRPATSLGEAYRSDHLR